MVFSETQVSELSPSSKHEASKHEGLRGKKMDNLKEMNKFMNEFWQFIKRNHDIPDQNDLEAWDKITAEASELCKAYQGSMPKDKMFRAWVVDYLDYMSVVSRGKNGLISEMLKVVNDI